VSPAGSEIEVTEERDLRAVMDLFVKKDRDDLPGRLRRSQVRGPRLVRVRVASRRQPPADGEPHIWGRVVGQHGLQGCAANLEKDVDYDMFAVRAGMDLYYAEGPDGGSDRAGIYGAIGNASGEAHLFDVSVGSNDNDAYTVGGDWRRTTAGRGGMSMPFCRAPGTTSKPIRTARSRSRPPASASAHRWRPAIRSRWRVAGSSSRRHSWHISQEREGASLVAVMNSLIGDCSRRMKSIRDCIRAD
jgi:hypothetical protein